jgi:hypothetical protein
VGRGNPPLSVRELRPHFPDSPGAQMDLGPRDFLTAAFAGARRPRPGRGVDPALGASELGSPHAEQLHQLQAAMERVRNR